MKRSSFTIRKAKVRDARKIYGIVNRYARQADLVIRTLEEIYSQIRDYILVEANRKVAGLIALHVYSEGLAEIRSFVMEKEYRGNGSGKKLFYAAMKEAKEMGIKKVFVLTKIPDFFTGQGFRVISKKRLPQKIWKDCFKCIKFPDCDETALIRKV